MGRSNRPPFSFGDPLQNKYQGHPCSKCNSTLRYVSNRRCVDCHLQYERSNIGRESHLQYTHSSKGKKTKKNWRVQTLYGLTKEEYDKLAQQKNCAICSKLFGKDTPLVDHNHHTGKVRGLLCRPCNSAIGFLHDNPQLCEAAAVYLRK